MAKNRLQWLSMAHRKSAVVDATIFRQKSGKPDLGAPLSQAINAVLHLAEGSP
jgi:hypothetical protein